MAFLFGGAEPFFCNFGKGHYERPCSLVEQNHLCNFCRGHYWEHSCEPVVRSGDLV